jgi:hypothetical protein
VSQYKFTRIPLPPDLKKPEIDDFADSEQRERKRWGLLEDWLWHLFNSLIKVTHSTNTCDCFRWILTIIATVDDTGAGAQQNFTLAPHYELEDNERPPTP